MILDTGSNKSWFTGKRTPAEFNDYCTNTEKSCDVISDPNVSSYKALHHLGKSIVVKDAVLISDDVRLDNRKKSVLTKFWLDYVTKTNVIPNDFESKFNFDGVAAMAPGAYNGLVDSLKNNKLITNRVFAFYFS